MCATTVRPGRPEPDGVAGGLDPPASHASPARKKYLTRGSATRLGRLWRSREKVFHHGTTAQPCRCRAARAATFAGEAHTPPPAATTTCGENRRRGARGRFGTYR